VGLNIKSERVHALAREAAARSGLTQTSAIEEALRRYLDDLSRAERRERAEEILADLRSELAGQDLHRDIEELYDAETGLPR
jgi:antitoxin VapB